MPARALAAALLAVTLGCGQADRPPYTRVEGRAPPVVPADGAVLVVFWATWCPPCVEELPSLRALGRSLPAGLSLVTFGEDEGEGPVRRFFGGPPPPELGYRHDVGRRVAEAFGVDVLPAAFLVVDGEKVARFAGARDWDARGMRALLTRLAGEPARAAAPGSRPGVDARSADR